jgi:hypothetical protein
MVINWKKLSINVKLFVKKLRTEQNVNKLYKVE